MGSMMINLGKYFRQPWILRGVYPYFVRSKHGKTARSPNEKKVEHTFSRLHLSLFVLCSTKTILNSKLVGGFNPFEKY